VKGWSLRDVDALYTDNPNVMLKVEVEQRSRFVTDTKDERVLKTPEGLYEEIQGVTSSEGREKTRSFVRPSGTEDIVRIYAEGKTLEEAHEIANSVKGIIEERYSKA
jgi:phosphoacetylglucosamine mutase